MSSPHEHAQRGATGTPLLRFESISKRFGGTQAVDQVSLDVWPGEILALLGENGAGKSTLIKLLAGIYPSDHGEIYLDGQAQRGWRSAEKRRQPVAFIHQDLGLVEWMTVAENVCLGMGYPRRWGLIDWATAAARARRALARVGCDIDPERRVFSLTRAEKSLLAIGRALEVQARVLVLDEPSASLPRADVLRLFEVLRHLRAQGMAMVYVSHRLDEVMAISDRAAVMRDGQLVALLQTHRTDAAELVQHIIGQAAEANPSVKPDDRVPAKAAPAPGLAPATPSTPAAPATPVLELIDCASGNAGPVSFAVQHGEVLGLVGLRGAGQEAISRALFGREPMSAGQLRLQGQPQRFRSPADAIGAGVACVASERLEENLAAPLSVQENLFPNPRLHAQRGLSLQHRRRERSQAQALIRRFDIKPAAPHAPVQQLSGGNQQKVVLARWFALGKPLTVLEEPTAGVDVGAKQQIYALLRERAAAGAAQIIVSTDFEEVATVCSRVLVFRGGVIAAELHGAEINVGRLLAAAAGGALTELEAP